MSCLDCPYELRKQVNNLNEQINDFCELEEIKEMNDSCL